jgi:D-alanine transaminase
MQLAMLDEKIVPYNELDPIYLDHGTFFGYGVYEVMRSYSGKIFALEDHLARLEYSLSQSMLQGPGIEVVRERILRAFNDANIADAKIYLQITRGCGTRSHLSVKSMKNRFFLTVTELPDASEQKKNGIKVITTEDIRWKRCDIKSLNLMANVMATEDAERQGCKEALFVNGNGDITEGASSAFFVIKDGALYTSGTESNILPSVTRKHILKIAELLKIPVRFEHPRPDGQQQWDEAFIAVTTRDIVGVVECDKKPIGDGKVGKITRQIESKFAELV